MKLFLFTKRGEIITMHNYGQAAGAVVENAWR